MAMKQCPIVDLQILDGSHSIAFGIPPLFSPSTQNTRHSQALHSLESMTSSAALRELFVEFASFGAGQTTMKEMDGSHFAKLCRDCGLIDSDFSLIDVDILFAKVKVRGKRRIGFPQFVTALQMMAEKKGVSLRHLEEILASSQGPTLCSNARVDNDRLLEKLTDTSLYTGAHKVGAFIVKPFLMSPNFDVSICALYSLYLRKRYEYL